MAKPTEKQNIADVFPEICTRVSLGELLTDICDDLKISRYDVYRWMNEDVDNRLNAYTRARDEQQHSWADQIVKLSDTCRPGDIVTEKGDGTVEIKTADMVERTRLQIESRKWLMARLNPKAYGDKIQTEISGKDGGALVVKWEK